MQWTSPFPDSFFKKVWVVVYFIILWSIWKERNSRIFQQVSMNTQQTEDLNLLRLGWWIKGWELHFSYSPEDFLRNPQCLRWSSLKDNFPTSPPNPTASIWSPPPGNHLNWNVDASLHTVLNKTSIGGVLRDSDGKFMCIFSRK
ncbi:uncharacterized protein [Spinacia oleracea]|uniref:RNase H type-1 domain-containing protein n=1 Tax=Spinacia oleracea TaxID=3562 RepID=A0ABM3R8C1_SPIOL|nr:uncharacterized protein LOC130467387 [Spinacia oleracea]